MTGQTKGLIFNKKRSTPGTDDDAAVGGGDVLSWLMWRPTWNSKR